MHFNFFNLSSESSDFSDISDFSYKKLKTSPIEHIVGELLIHLLQHVYIIFFS